MPNTPAISEVLGRRLRLDESMTRSDLVEALRRLKFEERYCTVWIDQPVRDFQIAVPFQ